MFALPEYPHGSPPLLSPVLEGLTPSYTHNTHEKILIKITLIKTIILEKAYQKGLHLLIKFTKARYGPNTSKG